MNRLIPLLLAVVWSIPVFADNHESKTVEFDPTFTHVVYFWLKEPENPAHRAQFESAAKKFMADSEYAKTRFLGIAPKATRDVVDDSFTYSLILSFESAEAQAKYQAEAAHDAFVESCKDLWAKVIVYDSVPLE